MSAGEKIWRTFHSKLIADPKKAVMRGAILLDLTKRKATATRAGKLDEFYSTLMSEYPEYFEGSSASSESDISPVSSASSASPPPVKKATVAQAIAPARLPLAPVAKGVPTGAPARLPLAPVAKVVPTGAPARSMFGRARPVEPVMPAPLARPAGLVVARPAGQVLPAPLARPAGPARPAGKAVAPARLFQQPAESEPVRSAETLTSGDCFYSSIWRASGEQGVREPMLNCFAIQIPPGKTEKQQELMFIQTLRRILAQRIRNDNLFKEVDPRNGRQKNAYDGLQEKLAEGGMDLYKETIRIFPDWFKAKFGKGLLDTKQEFLTTFAKEVETMTRWVSEIEVQMVEEMLKDICGILLEKHNHDIPYAFRTKNGMPLLNLHNKSEYHWEFFSFNVPAGYTASSAFRAKLINEQRLLEGGEAVREFSEAQVLARLAREARGEGGGRRRKRKTRKLKSRKQK